MAGELIVLITAPDVHEAKLIANALVEERLAACVNIIHGVESVYRWEGQVTRDSEQLLVVKTVVERLSGLEARVKELHSYSTPEIVAFSIERGSAAYLKWLRDSTAEDECQTRRQER